jgi:ribosomal protein S18 acetylase RimI-like enzyme
MQVTVRPWRADDRAAVLALNGELQEHERGLRPSLRPGAEMAEEYLADLEQQLARLGDDGALLVAERADGKVVGFATCFIRRSLLERDAPELVVEDLCVAAGTRRCGVGRALVEATAELAARRGIRRIELSVLTVNEGAAAAYARMGFAPVRLTLERLLPGPDPDAKLRPSGRQQP